MIFLELRAQTRTHMFARASFYMRFLLLLQFTAVQDIKSCKHTDCIKQTVFWQWLLPFLLSCVILLKTINGFYTKAIVVNKYLNWNRSARAKLSLNTIESRQLNLFKFEHIFIILILNKNV